MSCPFLKADKLGMIKQGDKFNSLTAIRFDHIKINGRNRVPYWLFKCDCGNESVLRVESVRNNRTYSCGCLRIKNLRKKLVKHQACNTSLYSVWQSMKDRCNNPNNTSYKNYGGRGITVCESWQKSFMVFKNDIGKQPFTKCDIDRIDNNKGYSKENCHWATRSQNMQNARTSRLWFIHGKRFSALREAADFFKVNNETIRYWCGLRKNSGLPLCYSVKVYSNEMPAGRIYGSI